MSDKDFTERRVFTEEFPNAVLQICLFHILQSLIFFAVRLLVINGHSTRKERTCTRNFDEIGLFKIRMWDNEHYQSSLQSDLTGVISYHNAHWHKIRDEWVECYRGVQFTLGERTNNRLESINGKIKSVCNR